MKRYATRPVIAWAFYDWANSAFATTVMAGFFPLFFKQYWAGGLDSTASTFQLGLGNAVASLLIVLAAPLLGAIADRGGLRKRFLLLFALLGMACTAALGAVGEGEWAAALGLFVAATVGFMGANVFYDALLTVVAREQDWDVVSALGYALGYLGGGLLFGVNVAMTLSPASFGLEGPAQAVRFAFFSVGLWWLLFSVPLMLMVREPPVARRLPGGGLVRAGYRQVRDTFAHIRQLRPVFLFLVAYWLYIDGVDTIVRMAVDYGLAIGLEQTHLIGALLITQFVGFPAALAFGWLGQRLGARRGIYLAIGVYVGVTLWATVIGAPWEFYVLAACIGLVQGGIQALSRSLYARLIPADKAAEFFGFYNMLGKFAALLGPLMVGYVSLASGSHRAGMLSLILLFVSGAWLLSRVEVVGEGRDRPADR